MKEEKGDMLTSFFLLFFCAAWEFWGRRRERLRWWFSWENDGKIKKKERKKEVTMIGERGK